MDIRNYLAVCVATLWAGILPNHLVLIPDHEEKLSYILIEEYYLDGRLVQFSINRMEGLIRQNSIFWWFTFRGNDHYSG